MCNWGGTETTKNFPITFSKRGFVCCSWDGGSARAVYATSVSSKTSFHIYSPQGSSWGAYFFAVGN